MDGEQPELRRRLEARRDPRLAGVASPEPRGRAVRIPPGGDGALPAPRRAGPFGPRRAGGRIAALDGALLRRPEHARVGPPPPAAPRGTTLELDRAQLPTGGRPGRGAPLLL